MKAPNLGWFPAGAMVGGTPHMQSETTEPQSIRHNVYESIFVSLEHL
jgi:hypothetical protein